MDNPLSSRNLNMGRGSHVAAGLRTTAMSLTAKVRSLPCVIREMGKLTSLQTPELCSTSRGTISKLKTVVFENIYFPF